MRRVIRKRIRRKEDGLDLAIDFNADVAVNVGRSTRPASSETPASEADRPPERPSSTEPPDERKDP